MANLQTNEFEEYVKCLLKCLACIEPIKSAPIHQCTNGHVVCKDCVTKLEYCPICRNDSTVVRNLVFEQIIGNFSTYELASEGPTKNHELQKCEVGSVSASFSKNEPKKGPSVHINIQPDSDTIELAENGVSKFEEYIKSLLECPVCVEPIKSAPIHQCANGHLVCKDCISKMDNCPICRNDSTIAKNLIFEQIIGNFSTFELGYVGPSEKPEVQKWGHGFVSASFSNNGPNVEPSVQINLPPTSEAMESLEHGGSYNRLVSIFKGIKHAAISNYNSLLYSILFYKFALISFLAGAVIIGILIYFWVQFFLFLATSKALQMFLLNLFVSSIFVSCVCCLLMKCAPEEPQRRQ